MTRPTLASRTASPVTDTRTERAIDRLASMFPAQDRTASRIALAIYRRLAVSDRATVQDIATVAEVSTEQVARQIEAWPAVYRDEDGAVIGFWGLTGYPMSHRFTVGGHDRFTWCAWDTLFIPELIGQTAEVRSTTPIAKRPVRLRVSPQGVKPLDGKHPPLYVSFRLPDDDEWEADVIATFCHHVFFLREDETDRWLSANPGGVTLGLDDAFRAGQLKNAHQFQV